MQEAFIHFVWKNQYFNKTDLYTTDGVAINVLKQGFYNTDSGPDFKEAKLVIDNLEWQGSIEIHHRSSDWVAHHHTEDKAYNNVILHVVWQHDKEVKRSDGTQIPTLEIANRVESKLIDSYKSLINSLQPIPCADQLTEIDDLVVSSMMDKMMLERLDEKAAIVNKALSKNKNDWETTAFHVLTKNFGFKTNADQFQRLAELVPSKLFSKHGDNLLLLEALLFGQAGFLEMKPRDQYQEQLKKEHQFLRHKYNLPEPMSEFQWKFMRLRPANFPTLRIAQLAAIMQHSQGLFSRTKEIKDVHGLKALFSAPCSSYWLEHYRFGKRAETTINGIGMSSIQNIGINTVAPLLTAYGKSVDQGVYVNQAMELLQSLNAETNKIMKVWKGLGIKPVSSFDSQALIQLYNNYCSKKRCLNCNIGNKILQRL